MLRWTNSDRIGAYCSEHDEMTPADIAMRNALYESICYPVTPPTVTSGAMGPLPASHPDGNLTSYSPPSRQLSDISASASSPSPNSLHLAHNQFRQPYHSSALSSTSDLDYKRVRRKRSLAHLVRAPFDFGPLHPASVPPSPSLQLEAARKFSPSLLPLTPSPALRPSPTAPSLCSTADTRQSTPLRTPLEPPRSRFQSWGKTERTELSQPLQTKRKFTLPKQPKRLPHPTGTQHGADDIWQVHAAVIDHHGVFESFRTPQEPIARTGEKKGRSVRFQEVSNTESGRRDIGEKSRSKKTEESTLSSDLSLSTFRFPLPPTGTLAKEIGRTVEPTPPTSPTTLQYKGASFDVVNPHRSLLLGSSTFETPAEIDGLLDEYFDRSEHDMASYDHITGEISTPSQQSLGSVGARQRTLYADPDSARRTILGIGGSHSAPEIMDVEDESSDSNDDWIDEEEPISAVDRGSSLYPPSQRSDLFPLSVSDSENGDVFNNIAGVMATDRGSYFAGNAAEFDFDAEFTVYQDSDDANASRNIVEEDTTVGNIVDYYRYIRPPLNPLDDVQVDYNDGFYRSSSIELGRSLYGGQIFQMSSDPSGFETASPFENRYEPSRITAQTNLVFDQPGGASRMFVPPSIPAPTPRRFDAENRVRYDYSDFTDVPTTERTYGNTGNLLQLTPQDSIHARHRQRTSAGSPSYPFDGRRAEQSPFDSAGLLHAVRNINEQPMLDDGEGDDADKENTPQTCDIAMMSLSTIRQHIVRSSSHYPEDRDSVWESVRDSASILNVGRMDQRLSAMSYDNSGRSDNRDSTHSYADTSHYGSEARHSLPPTQHWPADEDPYQCQRATVGRPRGLMEPDTLYRKWSSTKGNQSLRLTSHGTKPDLHELAKTDAKTAAKLLEADILEDALLGGADPWATKQNKAQHKRDLYELSQIRSSQPPSTLSKTVAFVAERLGRPKAKASNADAEDRHLLAPAALRTPDSASILSTAARAPSTLAGGPESVKLYSPLSPTPPAAAVLRRSRFVENEEETLPPPIPISTSLSTSENAARRWDKRGVSAQTSLHPLHLAAALPTTTPTTLSDAALLSAAPSWTVGPRRHPLDLPSSPHLHPSPRKGEAEQHTLTKPWYQWCRLCPLTALLFGLGAFDWVVRRASEGRVDGMEEGKKWMALWLWFGLGVCVWGVVGVGVGTGVVASFKIG